ncbi:hypothetical protein LUZ60_013491 [Juncus effusus]|nr:hypothetical protein LUZ60_013491 [Juncus effusus]
MDLTILNTHFLLKSTLVFLSTVLFIKLLIKISTKRENEMLPPTSKTFPVIRRIIALIRKGQEPTLIREQYERLGSVFTLNFFARKVTFLIEPDVVEYFFKATEKVLHQREVYKIVLPIHGRGVLFDANILERRRQMGIFVEALQTSKFPSYVNLMVAEVEEYFSKWKDCGTVDLKHELNHLLLAVGTRCLLGEDMRATMAENFVSLIVEVENGITTYSHISPYLPIPPHSRRDRARAKLTFILSNIIDERIKSGTSNEDLIQSFIDKYKSENYISKDQIIGLIMTALVASHHTSSLSSFWNGVYLLHHPEFLSSVIEEQTELMRRHGNKIDFDILGQMNNLYRCIKESNRLQPTAFMLLRYLRSDFPIRTKEGREFVIPKGQVVAVAPSVVNRLPFLYKEPDTFDPDRFADGREEDKIGGPFANINFGGGRNACPGNRFAYLVIQVIWSILLRKFELELASPFSTSELSSMYSRPPEKVLIHYKRRELPLNK